MSPFAFISSQLNFASLGEIAFNIKIKVNYVQNVYNIL